MSVKCENCLSKNVCRWYENGTGKNLCCADDFPCPEQKDKNHFIKVPCKVGDVVYYLARSLYTHVEKVKSGKVLRIAITENGIDLFVDNWTAKLPYGKRAFLTKEEAEEKLKELKCSE